MIATDVERIEQILSEVLMDEWEAQGHAMTSKVVKEIDYRTKYETNSLILSGMIYPYGNIIAAGVKPGKVPFGGKRGRTSLYIQALQNYAKQRMGIQDEQKSLSVAFAIAKTQKKEGMPTYSSYSFSRTGKRTDWVEEAFRKNEEKITEAIRDMGYGVLTASIDVLLAKWNLELNKN